MGALSWNMKSNIAKMHGQQYIKICLQTSTILIYITIGCYLTNIIKITKSNVMTLGAHVGDSTNRL